MFIQYIYLTTPWQLVLLGNDDEKEKKEGMIPLLWNTFSDWENADQIVVPTKRWLYFKQFSFINVVYLHVEQNRKKTIAVFHVLNGDLIAYLWIYTCI